MELEGRQIRLAFVGAGCVGKTCIIKRYVENSFQGNPYNPTSGIDFFSRRITVRPHGTGTLIMLDIGGLAIDSKMLGIYLKSGVDILMLMYDVTNVSSINELRKWMDIIKVHVDLSKTTLALVGCKADLEHLRTVRLDSHTRFKQEYDIPLSFIVSAKSGENIQTCFTTSTVYFINPDGGNKIRENIAGSSGGGVTQTQNQLPSVPSTVSQVPHPPQGPVPVPSSAIRRQTNQQTRTGGGPSAGSAGASALNNDINSAVCSIQ